MRKKNLTRTACALIIFCLAACAAPQKQQQEKAMAYRDWGKVHLIEGNYASALEKLLEAEKLNPDDPYLHDYLGLTYDKKKRYGLAIQHFQKALKLKPDYTAAKNNLGNVYLHKGEWDTAIALFEEVNQDLLYQTPHFPLANIGSAYYQKKEYPLAESYYRRALALQPKFIAALNGLGKTYLAMDKPGKAVQTFEKALKIAPDTAALHLNMGKAHAQMGEIEKARKAYRKVMDLQPDSELSEAAKKDLYRLKRQSIW